MEDKNTENALCEDCLKLVGSGRSTPPHINLHLTENHDVRSIMGAADEEYYTCQVCCQKWLHETGSCGMGWVK